MRKFLWIPLAFAILRGGGLWAEPLYISKDTTTYETNFRLKGEFNYGFTTDFTAGTSGTGFQQSINGSWLWFTFTPVNGIDLSTGLHLDYPISGTNITFQVSPQMFTMGGTFNLNTLFGFNDDIVGATLKLGYLNPDGTTYEATFRSAEDNAGTDPQEGLWIASDLTFAKLITVQLGLTPDFAGKDDFTASVNNNTYVTGFKSQYYRAWGKASVGGQSFIVVKTAQPLAKIFDFALGFSSGLAGDTPGFGVDANVQANLKLNKSGSTNLQLVLNNGFQFPVNATNVATGAVAGFTPLYDLGFGAKFNTNITDALWLTFDLGTTFSTEKGVTDNNIYTKLADTRLDLFSALRFGVKKLGPGDLSLVADFSLENLLTSANREFGFGLGACYQIKLFRISTGVTYNGQYAYALAASPDDRAAFFLSTGIAL